jgi:hypothetical protein
MGVRARSHACAEHHTAPLAVSWHTQKPISSVRATLIFPRPARVMDITSRLNDPKTYIHAGVPRRTTDEEEVAELMTLGINHPARKRYREKRSGQQKKWEALEKGWDRTPLRYRPAEVRVRRIRIKCYHVKPSCDLTVKLLPCRFLLTASGSKA